GHADFLSICGPGSGKRARLHDDTRRQGDRRSLTVGVGRDVGIAQRRLDEGSCYRWLCMRIADSDLRHVLAPPTGERPSVTGLRDAAVLAPMFVEDGADRLLFTRRRDDLAHHAGEVSFPGGAREGDEDALACALRECAEEIGLRAERVTILGRL